MIAGRHSDPALRLLIEAEPEDAVLDAQGAPVQGGKALLILAGDGALAAAYAPRFAEVHCHNAYHPQHAAALAATRSAGLANVRCVLGDLPCVERAADSPNSPNSPNPADKAGEGETLLSTVRYPEGTFDAIAFRLGQGTALLNAVLAESFLLLKPGGVLTVAGHNQEGIKSFAKRAEAHFGNQGMAGLKSGCRLLRYRKESQRPVEAVEAPRYFHPVRLELEIPGGRRIEYLTKPGIFAYRATDPGTALLAKHLPDCSGKSVLDLGCGSGALSLAAFALGAESVLATDSSAIAIACAEANFTAQGRAGKTHCGDLGEGLQGGFDLVLSNPPFHKDGETDYGLPERILNAIWRQLRPGGEAYLVANQFLDYSALARKVFGEASIVVRDPGYLIHRMVKAA
jgi:16S rRNA (guanine1207-N2)-methyltransferase